MKRRRGAVSGMWVRWILAQIWKARGVGGRAPPLDPHLAGHRSRGVMAEADQRYTLEPHRGRRRARKAR